MQRRTRQVLAKEAGGGRSTLCVDPSALLYGTRPRNGSATHSHGDKVDLAINLGTPDPG